MPKVGEFHLLSFSFHYAAGIFYCRIEKFKQLKKMDFARSDI